MPRMGRRRKVKPLKIDSVTSVEERVESLQTTDQEGAKIQFLENGGWNLLHDWIQQAHTSKNTNLVHSILNLLKKLPTASVSVMLEDKNCGVLSVLETIVREEVDQQKSQGGGGSEETKRLCVKLLKQWHGVIQIRDTNEENAVPDMELDPKIKFTTVFENGKEVTFQATKGKVWWVMTMDGKTNMVKMKQKYWEKKMEVESSSTNEDGMKKTDVPPPVSNSNATVPIPGKEPEMRNVQSSPVVMPRDNFKPLMDTDDTSTSTSGEDVDEEIEDDSSRTSTDFSNTKLSGSSSPPVDRLLIKRKRHRRTKAELKKVTDEQKLEEKRLEKTIRKVKKRLIQRKEHVKECKLVEDDGIPPLFRKKSRLSIEHDETHDASSSPQEEDDGTEIADNASAESRVDNDTSEGKNGKYVKVHVIGKNRMEAIVKEMEETAPVNPKRIVARIIPTLNTRESTVRTINKVVISTSKELVPVTPTARPIPQPPITKGPTAPVKEPPSQQTYASGAQTTKASVPVGNLYSIPCNVSALPPAQQSIWRTNLAPSLSRYKKLVPVTESTSQALEPMTPPSQFSSSKQLVNVRLPKQFTPHQRTMLTITSPPVTTICKPGPLTIQQSTTQVASGSKPSHSVNLVRTPQVSSQHQKEDDVILLKVREKWKLMKIYLKPQSRRRYRSRYRKLKLNTLNRDSTCFKEPGALSFSTRASFSHSPADPDRECDRRPTRPPSETIRIAPTYDILGSTKIYNRSGKSWPQPRRENERHPVRIIDGCRHLKKEKPAPKLIAFVDLTLSPERGDDGNQTGRPSERHFPKRLALPPIPSTPTENPPLSPKRCAARPTLQAVPPENPALLMPPPPPPPPRALPPPKVPNTSSHSALKTGDTPPLTLVRPPPQRISQTNRACILPQNGAGKPTNPMLHMTVPPQPPVNSVFPPQSNSLPFWLWSAPPPRRQLPLPTSSFSHLAYSAPPPQPKSATFWLWSSSTPRHHLIPSLHSPQMSQVNQGKNFIPSPAVMPPPASRK